MLSPIAMRHYVSVMEAKGVSASTLLTGVGVETADILAPDFTAEPSQYRAVVSNILKLDASSGIGFDMGLKLTVQDMGALGYAVMTCKSIRDTVKLWNRYGKTLVGNLLELDIVVEEIDPDVVSIEYRGRDILDPVFRFQVEEALGMLMLEQSLVGEAPIVERVSLAYPAPRHEHRYHELFGDTVRFGASRNRITMDKTWFNKNVRTSDDGFNRVCLEYCESSLRQMECNRPVTQRLRGYLLSRSGALPSLAKSAAALNITERTLRRRLEEEGTTFRNVIEAWRMDRAREYFRQPDPSAKEVAYLLGFNEASALRHAFKKWTGQTINEYRNQVLASKPKAFGHH